MNKNILVAVGDAIFPAINKSILYINKKPKELDNKNEIYFKHIEKVNILSDVIDRLSSLRDQEKEIDIVFLSEFIVDKNEKKKLFEVIEQIHEFSNKSIRIVFIADEYKKGHEFLEALYTLNIYDTIYESSKKKTAEISKILLNPTSHNDAKKYLLGSNYKTNIKNKLLQEYRDSNNKTKEKDTDHPKSKKGFFSLDKVINSFKKSNSSTSEKKEVISKEESSKTSPEVTTIETKINSLNSKEEKNTTNEDMLQNIFTKTSSPLNIEEIINKGGSIEEVLKSAEKELKEVQAKKNEIESEIDNNISEVKEVSKKEDEVDTTSEIKKDSKQENEVINTPKVKETSKKEDEVVTTEVSKQEEKTIKSEDAIKLENEKKALEEQLKNNQIINEKKKEEQNQELNEVKKKIEEKNQEINKIQNDLASKNEEAKQTKTLIETKNEEIKKLENQLASQGNNEDEINKIKNDLEQKLKEKEKIISEIESDKKAEILQLETQLTSMNDEMQNFMQKLNDSEKKISESNENENKLLEEIEKKNNEIKLLEQARAEDEKIRNQKNEQLKTKLFSMKDTEKTLLETINLLKKEVETLNKQPKQVIKYEIPDDYSKVIVIVSPSSVGKTEVASNIAVALSKYTSTSLIDLDFQRYGLAYNFKIDEYEDYHKYNLLFKTINEIKSKKEIMDEHILQELSILTQGNLSIYSGLSDLKINDDFICSENITYLIKELKKHSKILVLDVGRTLDNAILENILELDNIEKFIVSTENIQDLNTIGFLQNFSHDIFYKNWNVIINQYKNISGLKDKEIKSFFNDSNLDYLNYEVKNIFKIPYVDELWSYKNTRSTVYNKLEDPAFDESIKEIIMKCTPFNEQSQKQEKSGSFLKNLFK